MDASGVASTLATERDQIEKADNGIDLGGILGTLGGLGGLVGGSSSDPSSGGGGLMGMIGGLFGGKKKNG